MNWQGIPFKLLGEEPLQQAFLSVSHLPNIIVKNDFAFDTFLSGLCAGLIPAIVAVIAMRSNAKNIQDERLHQQKLAGENITKQIVSASRQVWINELRDAAAKYIGSVTSVVNCLNSMAEEYIGNNSESEYYLKLYDEQRIEKAELGLIKTKIELLLNPEEDDSQRVVLALENIRVFILMNRENHVFLEFDELRRHTTELKLSIYSVIKNEWNKIKDVKS
ncbi:hypothetical protein AB4M04_06035 [Serratia quinivorans]|uniref:Uncharacterized protein n=1 Tax=Serratia quinivorans TaxID=137545 RepID=A0ABV3UF69_9GAMM